MFKYKSYFFLLLLPFFAITCTENATPTDSTTQIKIKSGFLWKVEHPNNNTSAYLFATIHLSKAGMLPLPNKILEYLDTSDGVFVEATPTLSKNFTSQFNLTSSNDSADIGTLETDLDNTSKGLLKKYLREDLNQSISDLSVLPFEPFYIDILMNSFVFKLYEKALDTSIIEQSQNKAIPLQSLDTLALTIPAVGFNDYKTKNQQITILSNTLFERNSGEIIKTLEQLLNAYISQDYDESVSIITKGWEAMTNSTATINGKTKTHWEVLIQERNTAWTTTLKETLEKPANSGKQYFVAGGLAHFLAPSTNSSDSLIKMLKEANTDFTISSITNF